MTLEEREQLKEEIVDKVLIVNGPSSSLFITTLLDEIKSDVIKKAMEVKLEVSK